MTAPKSPNQNSNDQAAATDKLAKAGPKASVELSEAELSNVAGGRKAGKGQQEFLVVKMSDTLVSS